MRDIAEWLNLQVLEVELANLNAMDSNRLGVGVKVSQLSLRERRLDGERCEVVGRILIDCNRGEYEKRLAIAREIGRFATRTMSAVGPVWPCEVSLGQFASYELDECLANEFAYALLMPFSLVEKEKKQYEERNSYNQLSYLDWLQHLEGITMCPMFATVIGYEEFKKCQLFRRRQTQTKPPEV